MPFGNALDVLKPIFWTYYNHMKQHYNYSFLRKWVFKSAVYSNLIDFLKKLGQMFTTTKLVAKPVVVKRRKNLFD